jgi:hypothetical protein
MSQGSVHNSLKLKMSQFLDRRVLQSVPVPANIQQLRTAIEEEWDNIPQATINSLINAM